MADSVAVIVTATGPEGVGTALDVLEASAAMEMTVNVYFTGDSVPWLRTSDGGGDPAREKVAERMRTVKEMGTVGIYACAGAMARHGIGREDLIDPVDGPMGMAAFLGLAADASFTLSF